ncbi:hypothetical protein RHGRI_024030 [Rhododendron griersonianum]|uniref:ATP synthase subunit gamma, mitochondrial n=1 Tax=Rhododendron griersonianum TaxID=479676 RepID=A0AAV6J5R6_9ERIC|nr:hypothetical protein RHGRI_024030 [Rhododendron griersonianum]
MAMTALRREGKRVSTLISSPNLRSSLAPSEEQVSFGVRSISTQIVRNRMKSVKSIQKITKAMKMVAASKLRAIQVRAENSRGLWQPFTALLGDTPSMFFNNTSVLKSTYYIFMILFACFLPKEYSVLLLNCQDYLLISLYSPCLKRKIGSYIFKLHHCDALTVGVDVKKNVIVTISSDKGLCGGINSTSVKMSRALHKLNAGPDKEGKYVILGEKAKAQLIRDSKKDIEISITELQKNPLNYTQVSVLADDILKNVEFDALRIVFNKFQSVVSYLPTTATILSPEVVEKEAEAGGKLGDLDSYEIEGGETKSEVLQNLTEFQFSCVLFNAVLENACSEQGARMSAMDSSSRNAGDMLDRLTLSYNRTRQASITTELIEIISGASALTG